MHGDSFLRFRREKLCFVTVLRILNVVLSIRFPTFSPQSWDVFCSEEQRNRAFPLRESSDNRRERDVFAFWNEAIVLHASRRNFRFVSFPLPLPKLDIFYVRRANKHSSSIFGDNR